MRVAITGGTGFVGRHLADRFDPADVVIASRRTGVDVDDVDALTRAFEGCDAVAHCAGINREIGDQTYERVHVRGTAAVIEAARRTGRQARSSCSASSAPAPHAARDTTSQSGRRRR